MRRHVGVGAGTDVGKGSAATGQTIFVAPENAQRRNQTRIGAKRDMTNHLGAIREFVGGNFLFGEEGKLGDDTSFLESGIIDSTGLLELVGFLEERFGIRVADEELVPETLDSLTNLSASLPGKLDGKITT